MPQPDTEPTSLPRLSQALYDLGRRLTEARAAHGDVPQLLEACAASQQLACNLAGDDEERRRRRAALADIQAKMPAEIRSASRGPYLVTNLARLTNWLGEEMETLPQLALCRCGRSASKPFCDGTHAESGFEDAKDPNRVKDRRDRYVGQQLTVLDNRGICQHSGFCTDRLSTVFRLKQEPFVAPSGGRMDEIIRVVRSCPSGALGLAIDGREQRQLADHGDRREPAIEVSKDGPYRVTGSIRLLDASGAVEPRADGASVEHYALCRCGASQNKPFCSGMHWYAEFKDPVRDPEQEPSIFEWVGGLPALTRMTRIFYEKYVPEDPLLAPLFATMSPDHPERVAKWLGEVFSGPKDYSSGYGGYTRMISQHLGKALTEEKRARWVQLLLRSCQEAGLPADPEFRSVFNAYIDWGSRLALENSQSGAHPPENMPMPHWGWTTAAGPPGSRVSALGPAPDTSTAAVLDRPPVLPRDDEPVGFEKHIKTLFRHQDQRSMRFAFDLWAFDDVKSNAHAILERVRAGSMPCDMVWPPEWVETFERWVNTGMRA